MNYSYYDLGQRKAGEIVEVQLSSGANVLLLDGSNYSAFRAGRRHNYFGGLAKRTPVRLQIPRNGRWYLVIHLGGMHGSVRHSMRILPGALPEIRQPDLRTIISDVVEPQTDLPPGAEEFDLFISHATEDKEGIVRDLVAALDRRGVHVWYDETQLRIGDSLRRKIDSGLARSRFGLVVVSHAFFAKNWPQYELDGLVSLEMAGRQRILPVWHDITKDEVLDYSPSLADKVALNTASYTVEEIAAEIADVIGSSGISEAA
jgi:hypothetical protein